MWAHFFWKSSVCSKKNSSFVVSLRNRKENKGFKKLKKGFKKLRKGFKKLKKGFKKNQLNQVENEASSF